jgi:adenosylcobinamide-GDP ribazoletransferase
VARTKKNSGGLVLEKKEDTKKRKSKEKRDGQKEQILEEKIAEDYNLLDRIKYQVNKQSWFLDLKICVVVLTRVPIHINTSPESFSISDASRFFPIVGAAVGLVSALVLWCVSWFGFSPTVLALLSLLTMTLITGALHEDGLADTLDGLGGGLTREQKLRIMSDSQIGSYGVMALLFSFSIRWAVYSEICEASLANICLVLVAVAAASRAALPAVMHFVPVAREDGLSVAAGQPSLDRAIVAFLLGIGFLFFLLGFRVSIVALGVAILVAGMFVYFAAIRLGGQTGDVLGATQQITEVTILLAILMVGLE